MKLTTTISSILWFLVNKFFYEFPNKKTDLLIKSFICLFRFFDLVDVYPNRSALAPDRTIY